MKLEDMFWDEFDKKMATEVVRRLKTTNGWKGIKTTELALDVRDVLGTASIYHNIGGVISKLSEQGYIKRKKFTKKDFKKDMKEKHWTDQIEIYRYYLSRKGKRLYKEICKSKEDDNVDLPRYWTSREGKLVCK